MPAWLSEQERRELAWECARSQQMVVSAVMPSLLELPPPPQVEDKARPFAELRDSGLLWLINRVVFHPRGYALALSYRNGYAVGWKLLGDGSEVWRFDEPEDDEFARATATLGAHAAQTLS